MHMGFFLFVSENSTEKQLHDFKQMLDARNFSAWPRIKDKNGANNSGSEGFNHEYQPRSIELQSTQEKSRFNSYKDVLEMTGLGPLLKRVVDRDTENLSAHILKLDQIHFPIPIVYQLMHPHKEQSEEVIAAYKDIITVAIRWLNKNITETEQEEIAADIVKFEGQLANLTTPAFLRRNMTALLQRRTIEEIEKETSGFPLLGLLNQEFSMANITLNSTDHVCLYALEYLQKLALFLNGSVDLNTLYNFMGWRTVLSLAGFASQEFRNVSLELKKLAYGIKEEPPRWETCIGVLEKYMKELVGRVYVEKRFSSVAKSDGYDWMDNTTRKAAVAKLGKMVAKLGYPEWIMHDAYLAELFQYVGDLDTNETLISILVKFERNNKINELSLLRLPYNRTVTWHMGAAVVNAYYDRNANEMVFPAGILRDLFYQQGLPMSINLGAIGSIIAHEITHGYDDKGRQYDGFGHLSNWWTNSTLQQFNTKAKCFIEQYSNITDPDANMTLNGARIVGESIADNGGLRMAYKAFKDFQDQCEQETRLACLENVTAAQMFFISNAMVWCGAYKKEFLQAQIRYGPYAPRKYRVNTVMRNMQEFADAFKCSGDTYMNLSRNERCTLW
ncbi:neprilysin-1-like isoform X2 [Haemaphysalis longicornis]